MHDFLRESPLYQDILTEGREEGLEKGLEEGLEKGREEGYEAMRQTFLVLVQARFPQALWVAKALATNTRDLDILQNLILNVSLAKDLADVQQYFFELGEKINN